MPVITACALHPHCVVWFTNTPLSSCGWLAVWCLSWQIFSMLTLCCFLRCGTFYRHHSRAAVFLPNLTRDALGYFLYLLSFDLQCWPLSLFSFFLVSLCVFLHPTLCLCLHICLSFLCTWAHYSGTVLSGSKSAACGTSGLLDKDGRLGDKQFHSENMKISTSSQSHHSEPGLGKPGRGRWHTVQSHLASGNLSRTKWVSYNFKYEHVSHINITLYKYSVAVPQQHFIKELNPDTSTKFIQANLNFP